MKTNDYKFISMSTNHRLHFSKLCTLIIYSIIFSASIVLAACEKSTSDNSDNSETVSNSDTEENTDVEGTGQDGESAYTKQPKSKPTEKMMAGDLVGRILSEGEPRDYRGQDWQWRVDEGEIKSFKIDDVLLDSEDRYIVEALVTLKSNSNYSLDARIKLNYRFDNNEGWILDSAMSRSMKIISDGLYDDCISIEKYGSIYGVEWRIRNNCDVTLTVYYRTLHGNNIEKSYVTVKGNSEEKASVWSLDDCIIDYVLRDY